MSEFSKLTIQYGEHSDEKAGEQIYHHPLRQFAAAWLQGNTVMPVKALQWLCSDKSYAGQLERYHTLLTGGAERWTDYVRRCYKAQDGLSAQAATRWFDLVILQAVIHESGILGGILFCQSYKAYECGDAAKAFCLVYQAKLQYARALAGFEKAEHGIRNGFYRNDCLTDIRLTVEYLNILQGWLRINGEGADAHHWHREYLMSETDKNVMLLTNVLRPIPDDMLAERLSAVFNLKGE